MERYFLIDENSKAITILDQIFAISYEKAEEHFDCKGWAVGEVKSEFDWNQELKDECELNALEADYGQDDSQYAYEY